MICDLCHGLGTVLVEASGSPDKAHAIQPGTVIGLCPGCRGHGTLLPPLPRPPLPRAPARARADLLPAQAGVRTGRE